MIVKRIDENTFEEFPICVAMIGTFDGFHKGHQQLIERTLQLAVEKDVESAVITFDPDPSSLFQKGKSSPMTHLEDRIQIASSYGFDRFYICSFTKSFADMSVEAFHDFLKNLNVLTLICGFDFTYASRKSGNVQTLLSQDSFEVMEVKCLEAGDEKISSSRIREAIRQGEMLKAARYLGYVYSIPGKVVTGFQRGSRLLGFPTANLEARPGYTIPKKGVYAGYVLIDGKGWPSMINIGDNPTFDSDKLTIEANIFGFDRDIYDHEIRIFFECYLRPDQKFRSVDELINQLKSDQLATEQLLETHVEVWDQTRSLWRIEG